MADIEVTVSPATVTTVSVPSPVATPSVIYTGVQGPPGEGSSYNQSLNTTDSPTFSSLTIDNGDGATASVIATGFTISDGDNHANVSAVHISGSTDNGHFGTYYLDGEGVAFGIGDNTNAEVPTSYYGHGVIEYTTTSAGTKTFTLPSVSGTLALSSDVLNFSNIGYVFVTVTGNDVAPPPGGYYVITNSSNYYTQAAVYINEVNQSAKIYFSAGSWRLLNAITGTEYVQAFNGSQAPTPVPVINYTGTDSNGSPCSCSITFSSVVQSARPVSTVGNGSTNSAGTSQLVAHADHSHALASNVVTLTGIQTLTNKSITSSQITGLATVATSGSASDLGTGTLPDARLSSSIVTLTGTQTLTNKSISSGQITGLATVATSGSASDLGTGTLPDARLSSSIVTLTGTQTLTNKSISSGQITGLGTAAAKDIPATGNASATQVVYGSDTRLTDSRTPSSTLAHASSHASGGSDALTLSASQITGLASVATSGAYSALSGTPSLATVATSGSYTDLSNLPVIAKKSTADMNSTNTTLADVTGLTNFVLEANTMYRFEFAGRHTCVSGGSQYLVLNSTQAIANASAQGWYVIFGSRTDAGFSNPSGNLYAFINRSSTGNTNNPSAAVYYIVTGSSAPTMKIQFSQTGTATGTATLLSGAVAVFTKLI